MGSCTESIQMKKETFIKVKDITKNNNISRSFLIRSINNTSEYTYKIIDVCNSNEIEKKKILNEIEILKKINHPNILLLKTAYYTDDKKYLNVISEYADGGDLLTKLNEQKTKKEYFEDDALLNWFMQICLALKFLHKNNIIHRDIKPSNIFLIKDNFAKLGDFGVAKALSYPLMHAKTVVATPQYIAPEILNKEKYSFKVDIWGLGVTFYQLITLNFPFEGSTNEEIQENIINGNKKEIPQDCKIDPSFIEMINKMLSKRPDERPSAEDLLEKGIIKTRMECYLKENEFNNSQAENNIKEYEEENKDCKENKIIRIVEEKEGDLEDNNHLLEKRKKKAKYDISRSMALMSSEIIKKTKTLE